MHYYYWRMYIDHSTCKPLLHNAALRSNSLKSAMVLQAGHNWYGHGCTTFWVTVLYYLLTCSDDPPASLLVLL